MNSSTERHARVLARHGPARAVGGIALRAVKARAALAWREANSTLWFIPTLLVVGAIALSIGLLYVDATVGRDLAYRWWLFAGHAEGARAVLSAIATSLITVIAVAFSITVVAMQQASTQFTPRILRNFTRDRGNQVVLGTYIATFIYSLLVLRQVRSADAKAPAFIPTASISAAMLLALTSLALLIYFIHHASQSLQVSHLLGSIRSELDPEIDRLFPATFDARGGDAPSFDELLAHVTSGLAEDESAVCAARDGYLRNIDEEALSEVLSDRVRAAVVYPRVGAYVHAGDVLVRCWWTVRADPELATWVRGAFQLAPERSIEQDALFGIRQIADIGIKALSPGINDPTTAEESAEQLGAVMRRIMSLDVTSPLRELPGGARVLLNRPCFREYLDESFAQIRRAARSHVHVTLALLRILSSLAAAAPSGARRRVVQLHVREIVEALDRAHQMTLTDERRVRTAAGRALATADDRPYRRTAGDGSRDPERPS